MPKPQEEPKEYNDKLHNQVKEIFKKSGTWDYDNKEDILSDFDERFKDTQCNCFIDGHEKNEFCPSRTSFYNFSPDLIKSYIRSKIQEVLEIVKDGMDKRIRGEKPFMWLVGESAEAPLSLYDEFHKIDGYNTAVVTHKKLLDEEIDKLK